MMKRLRKVSKIDYVPIADVRFGEQGPIIEKLESLGIPFDGWDSWMFVQDGQLWERIYVHPDLVGLVMEQEEVEG
ncbi:hypothetical protein [Thermogutta sp.]|uniref:hypothetical protein n=1 Tax=Thermogutta sp. TaxID=1962930 RepID=UPI0032204A65